MPVRSGSRPGPSFRPAMENKRIGVPGGRRRRCNELDGRTWTRFSISVWSDLRKSANELALRHPAAFPLELAERVIATFTPGPNSIVLDPFAGSGTTLAAACRLGRQGVGLEIYPAFEAMFQKRLAQECSSGNCNGIPPRFILDQAHRVGEYLHEGEADLVLTSPPYWDIMLARRSADRQESRPYGENEADLGRIKSYGAYLNALREIFAAVRYCLKPGGYCIVAVMDLRKKNRFFPLHMDLSKEMLRAGYLLDDIIIWDRRHEYNRLRPLGYPSVFRVNKVHEFLLIFRNLGLCNREDKDER